MWLILFLTSTAYASTTFDLPHAIKFAMEHSPQITSEYERQKIRELELETARAKFLPSLDVAATHGVQKSTSQTPTEPWASQVGVKLTEKLYDNGQSITNVKIASHQKELALLQVRRTREQLAFDVASQFYGLSLAIRILEAKHEQQKTVNKQFAIVTDQFKQGISTKKDFLRLKAESQRARIDVDNGSNQIKSIEVDLKKTLGRIDEDFEFASLPVVQNSIKIPVTLLKMENTLDYLIAESQLTVKPLEVSLAERRRYPQVFLNAGANYDNQNYLNSPASFGKTAATGWNILLTLQYNIWDWGIQSRDVEIARANSHIEESEFQKTRLQIFADIQKLQIELARLSSLYGLSFDLMQASEESFGLIKSEYEEGKVPYLDYIKSVADLLDSRVKYYTDYFALKRILAKFSFYEGNLYASLATAD